MSEAKSLVGLHGGGLTNMLFMPENGRILELRLGSDNHNNCYFTLASDLGHDYYYLLNESDTQETFNANITVDLNELGEILKLMES
jgi:capsular polysaccharide biosynthesis protein